MRKCLTGALLFSVLGIGTGCASSDDGADLQSPQIVGESELACDTLATCSIADPACQQAILNLTACVRGDETPPLPLIRTITRDELRDELSTMTESSMSDADSPLPKAVAQAALAALHLLSPQASVVQAVADERADATAAFYRPDVKDVTVVSDTTLDPIDAMNALSHEFTHYLQDLQGQIKKNKADASDDESVSESAVCEGEAVVNSFRVLVQMVGRPASSLPWNELFTTIETNTADATNASDSPFITAVNQLPYALSPPYIEDVWERFGRGAVDGLFDHTPPSEVDWLGSYDGSTSPSRVEPLDCYPPLAPDGFKLVGNDKLGLSGVYAMLATQHDASLESAASWRNDELAFYTADNSDPNAAPQVLAVWRVRFDNAPSATEFARAIAPLQLPVTLFERELAISVSSEAQLAPLAAEALATCPSAQDFTASLPTSPMHANAALRFGHGRPAF